jgi:hypothetical protein
VATSVAIAFAASWKPFVSANASANETANHRPTGQSSAPHRHGIMAPAPAAEQSVEMAGNNGHTDGRTGP